jgi:hypothetical protein
MSNITVMAWFKSRGPYTQWQTVVTKGDSTWGDWGLSVNIDDGWAIFVTTNSTGGQNFNGHYGASLYNIGDWAFIAGSYDGATSKLYVSNNSGPTLFTKSASFSGDLLYNESTNVRFGITNLSDQYYNGSIDEIRISNIKRNDSWINTTYNTLNNSNIFLAFGQQEIQNVAPTLSNPNPSDNSIGQDLNPTLSITVNDTNIDNMDVTFRTNASGSWADINTNSSVPNGTYQQIPSNMNSINTTYWWSVNCTDGTAWVNATYSFNTSVLPTINNENPSNGSTGVSTTPVCNITVSDTDGGTVNVYFYENTTGSWVLQQLNSSVDVTAAANVVWNNYSNATATSTKYWWRVDATDGIGWKNETYYFTTSA